MLSCDLLIARTGVSAAAEIVLGFGEGHLTGAEPVRSACRPWPGSPRSRIARGISYESYQFSGDRRASAKDEYAYFGAVLAHALVRQAVPVAARPDDEHGERR